MGSATGLLVANLAEGSAGLANGMVQGRALNAQGKYEQGRFNANARLEALKAEDALQRGNLEANAVRSRADRLQGAQVAQAGASGVDARVGSPADVQAETGQLGAQDALTVRNNAWLEAWGHRVQAADLTDRGAMARIGARSAAGSTIATGGLQFARGLMNGGVQYDQYRDKTAPKDPSLYVKPPSGKNMSDPRNR